MPGWRNFAQFLSDIEAADGDTAREQLVTDLLQERPEWPWIDGHMVTFVHRQANAEQVALNLDIIETDPPFAPMTRIEGTSLWYVQRQFADDDLLDYLIAVDDPMTPLRDERDIVGRIDRHWRVDALNPRRIVASQLESSILRMPGARPVPDWDAMPAVSQGRVAEHEFSSSLMGFRNRKLWVYTPPEYDQEPGREYPLLILLDGQWMVGPLQIPQVASALIKHRRMQPVIIAMKQSGGQVNRMADYVSNDKHYATLLTELLPLLQAHYRIDSVDLGIGGVGVGAIAAAHAALKNPAIFNHLIMLSPPLGRGQAQKQLLEYADRFKNAPVLPRRIFQSVGRYEIKTRFYKPAVALAGLLQQREEIRKDVDHEFVELGSGHGLVAFKSIMPEAMAHIFPGEAHRGFNRSPWA